MNNFLKIKKSTQEGFTLIELLVATSLFAIVAVGGLSILLTGERVYKRISSNRVAIDNVNMAIDTITREIKFGSRYGCVNTVTDGSWNKIGNTNYNSFDSSKLESNSNNSCNAVAFTPQGDNTKKIVYYLDVASSTINEATYDATGSIDNQSFSLSQDIPVTSRDFVINDFRMNVLGIKYVSDTNGDYLQPRIDFSISGVVVTVKDSDGNMATSSVVLQSSISQRNLDN